MDNLVGRTLGQYQLVEVIHQGENAIYKGFQPSLNRYVAVKVLNPERAKDLAFTRQFRRNMQILVALEHPHLLPVFDYGQEGDLLYMVMRYVEGGPLKDRLPPAFSPHQAQQVVNAVAEALDTLHNRGLVYGNLKPSNLLMDELGQPLVADLGYTQGIDVGTAAENAYLSPEQMQGLTADRRTDVYALGVLLYEMVIGDPPQPGSVPNPRLRRPDLPIEVEKVILKAMALDPNQRFQSAGELSHALNLALPGQMMMATQPTPVAPPAPPEVQPEPEKSSKGLAWTIGIVALVGLAGLLACLFFVILFGPKENGGKVIVVVPTPAPALPSATALQNTNIRTGPALEYPVIGTLKKDQKAEALGRSPDGLWWVIRVPAAPGGQGWVSAELMQAENTGDLPVIQPPPVPTPTATRVVGPETPSAVIEGATRAQAGQQVSFTARSSQPSAGSQLTAFEWDFNDGATATGPDVTHVYNEPGVYEVSLTITDNSGAKNSTTHNINIEGGVEPPEPEPSPTAVINGPSQAEVGEKISFDAGGSQCAGKCVSYAWELGDGTTANAVKIDHSYNTAATFNVILTVTDDKGLSGTANFLIEVSPGEEPPPTEEPGADLENVEWVLDTTLAGTEITALFQNGTVNGSSGCNTYNAAYQTNGRNLTISSPTATQIMCEEEIMNQETEYLANLAAAQQYRVRSDQLKITGGQALNYTQR